MIYHKESVSNIKVKTYYELLKDIRHPNIWCGFNGWFNQISVILNFLWLKTDCLQVRNKSQQKAFMLDNYTQW